MQSYRAVQAFDPVLIKEAPPDAVRGVPPIRIRYCIGGSRPTMDEMSAQKRSPTSSSLLVQSALAVSGSRA